MESVASNDHVVPAVGSDMVAVTTTGPVVPRVKLSGEADGAIDDLDFGN